VELKAQTNENSQMFMDSIQMSVTQAPSRLATIPAQTSKITVNLEDAVQQEAKLFAILEVRSLT
jgi:Cu/Ag efflux protein CusF